MDIHLNFLSVIGFAFVYSNSSSWNGNKLRGFASCNDFNPSRLL